MYVTSHGKVVVILTVLLMQGKPQFVEADDQLCQPFMILLRGQR